MINISAGELVVIVGGTAVLTSVLWTIFQGRKTIQDEKISEDLEFKKYLERIKSEKSFADKWKAQSSTEEKSKPATSYKESSLGGYSKFLNSSSPVQQSSDNDLTNAVILSAIATSDLSPSEEIKSSIHSCYDYGSSHSSDSYSSYESSSSSSYDSSSSSSSSCSFGD